MAPAWRATARDRLPALARGLREGLRALEASKRAEYRLAPWREDLAPHFLNGRQIWSGRTYLDGRSRPDGGGPGRVHFTPFTKRVEMQSIELAFDDVPNQARTEEILRALEAILDRAIA
jgi:hypothetical protein